MPRYEVTIVVTTEQELDATEIADAVEGAIDFVRFEDSIPDLCILGSAKGKLSVNVKA